jgi:hypothetical protein
VKARPIEPPEPIEEPELSEQELVRRADGEVEFKMAAAVPPDGMALEEHQCQSVEILPGGAIKATGVLDWDPEGDAAIGQGATFPNNVVMFGPGFWVAAEEIVQVSR